MELNKISERYQKALVTVSMGFRTEEDIKNNGLVRFCVNEKNECVDYLKKIYNGGTLLILKINKTGFRSQHININSKEDFDNTINIIDEIFGNDNEIWVVRSSVKDCWRCRLYLSNEIENIDRFEMAFSSNDHILDNLFGTNEEIDIPFIRYERKFGNNCFTIEKSNLTDMQEKETRKIIENVFSKYSKQIRHVKEDLEILGLNGISFDIRYDDGYDFHDIDVSYGDIKKVINYYVIPYLKDK